MTQSISTDVSSWLMAALGLDAGNTPFPWQEKVLAQFLDKEFGPPLNIPTGLGKTSVIALWLIALAWHSKNGTMIDVPRRLVYVVNRRTVVDQATAEAEKLRRAVMENAQLVEVKKQLCSLSTYPTSVPLAISTLRGEFADNGEWRSDPARPAIIVGTVDMIGSRLLFSGYGRCGFKSKPLHAGLIGQDALLVHDEAHLEPAFQQLLECIVSEQRRGGPEVKLKDSRPLKVMALTATNRTIHQPAGENPAHEPLFGEADKDPSTESGRRWTARKWVDFHRVEKDVGSTAVALALEYRDSQQAILIFLRHVEDVQFVAKRLAQNKCAVETLTGTRRGWERDHLAKSNAVFARFLLEKDRRVPPMPGTVYLICTSAGEVGVNISADHMVCDLTPLDSMIQRFGRVNRFGRSEARIDVVHLVRQSEDSGKFSAFDQACMRTHELLQRISEGSDRQGRRGRSASPSSLWEMQHVLTQDERAAVFTPEPVIPQATDILFDAWALTTVRGNLPGRPPVADWLHGIAEWEPPETHVAWREEVSLITGSLLETYLPEDLLEDFPLKPHELLRDRSDRVIKHLEQMAEREPELPVWIVEGDGGLQIMNLGTLAESGRRAVEDATVILSPTGGGLDKTGHLDGSQAAFDGDDAPDYDIADKWLDFSGQPRRLRQWGDSLRPHGMRQVVRIDLPVEAGAEDDEEPEIRSWYWYSRPDSADDDGSRAARKAQELNKHLQRTEEVAQRLVDKLGLHTRDQNLAQAVVLAARWHDLGKSRRLWQRSIGNPNPDNILAKSGPDMRPLDITRYRHEFGSLLDVTDQDEFGRLDPNLKELVLHLIAAHHGRARPHFPIEEAFDPEPRGRDAHAMAASVPQRYARLQRRYGRWGLAWLESLVRAADAMASNAILDPNGDGNTT